MNKSSETLKNVLGHSIRAVIVLGLTAASGTAWAADPPKNEGNRDVNQNPDAAKQPVEAPNDGDLPPPESDYDPQPEVATPGAPAAGEIVQQAGTGGQTGYGRAGVLELGGSLGLQMATNMRSANLSPSIGWFLADNFQLSGIIDLSYVEVDEDSGTLFGVLAEPSYHLPFTKTVFGFFGLGMGASYVTGAGTGFAMAPRLGANFLVGRSGILSPTASWQYTTHDIDSTMTGDATRTTVVAVSSALRLNIGYTVMW
jgi:hypothetical protein